jgi:hypothetical protein
MNSRLGIVLLVILVMLVIGLLPVWPHSAAFGYWPSGGFGLVLLILILVLLFR